MPGDRTRGCGGIHEIRQAGPVTADRPMTGGPGMSAVPVVDDGHLFFEAGGDLPDVGGGDAGVGEGVADLFGVGVGQPDSAAGQGDGQSGVGERGECGGPVRSLDLAGGGVADDVGSGAGGDVSAVRHEYEPVALFGFLHVVGGDEHADTTVGLVVDGIPQARTREWIDAGSGFVEDEQVGFVRESDGEGELALQTEADIGDEVVGRIVQGAG